MKLKNLRNFFPSGLTAGFIVALMIGGFSNTAVAQMPLEEREAPPMETLPQEQMQRAVTYVDEIEENEIPEVIVKSLKETWQDYEIGEAYRGSDGSYKVNLSRGEEKVSAFYDAGGEFLRIKEEIEEETLNDDWR